MKSFGSIMLLCVLLLTASIAFNNIVLDKPLLKTTTFSCDKLSFSVFAEFRKMHPDYDVNEFNKILKITIDECNDQLEEGK